jgi:hypothetical protein
MPPIDLPPDNSMVALLIDLQRPREVISAGNTLWPSVEPDQDPAQRTPHPEWPHGGEPSARFLQSGSSVTSSSSASGTNTYDTIYLPVGPHETWLDSATDAIAEGFVPDESTVIGVYDVRSTGGATHQQHRYRNVLLRAKRIPRMIRG